MADLRGSLWLPPTVLISDEDKDVEWAYSALAADVTVERTDDDRVMLIAKPVYETPPEKDEADVGPVWLEMPHTGALVLAGALAKTATAKWVLHPPPTPAEVAAELRQLAHGGRGKGRVVPVEKLETLAWALDAA